MKLFRESAFDNPSIILARIRRRHWAVWLLAFAGLAFLLAPWPLYDKLWAIAYGICPQRPDHSLFFGQLQMPIEAREGGMFTGFLLGLTFLALIGRSKARKLPPPKIIVILIGFVAIMGLDGLNAVAYDLYMPTPYDPRLDLRLGTGLLTGLAIAGFLLPVFNETVGLQSKPIASIAGWRELGLAVLFIIFFWMVGLSGWELLLYPISIMAAAGQVILMVGLATMLAAMVLRRGGRVSDFTELSQLILVGLVAVTIILGTTSAVRYGLFGPGPMPALR